jgi:hypothetical protein
MRAVTLTSVLNDETLVIDADKVSWIRDTGIERVVFLDGQNVVGILESRDEIVARIYAAEGSQPGFFYPVVVIFAFVAGLVLGTIF